MLFRDIYLIQHCFSNKEGLGTHDREKKNKSEIVIVYFYASNNPAVEKTSLQKLLAHIRSRALYSLQ